MNLIYLLEGSASGVDFTAIASAVSGLMTTADVLSIFTSVIAAAGGIFVVWFGARKVLYAVQSAIKSGNIHI